MAAIRLEGIDKAFGSGQPVLRRHRSRHRRRRASCARRAVGQRQEHRAADHRRARGAHARPRADRRAGCDRGTGRATRSRDGVPELRAVPAQDRSREPRVRASDARHRPHRHPHARRSHGRLPRLEPLCSSACLHSCPAASASEWPSAEPSCATHAHSCSMNHSRISIRDCAETRGRS